MERIYCKDCAAWQKHPDITTTRGACYRHPPFGGGIDTRRTETWPDDWCLDAVPKVDKQYDFRVYGNYTPTRVEQQVADALLRGHKPHRDRCYSDDPLAVE